MRSAKLVPTLAVAMALVTTLLAPTAAGASAIAKQARKHPSPSGRCAVNINLAPHQITAGDSIVVFGALRCHPASKQAGQTVTLLEHTVGAGGFGAVQTTTTDAGGSYEFTVAAVSSDGNFFVRSHGAASGRRAVRVAAEVTLNGPPEGTLLTGVPNRVTFTGTVSPADAGALVVLQRQNAATGNEWHRIDRGQVAADGSFSIIHTFRVPGDANIRVLVRSQRRNSPSISSVLNYEVSQTENPNLTITASVDPIPYGQSGTISGTVAGGANEPVTLDSRTAGQPGFSPVAQGMTDGGGNYTFHGQAPSRSTFYQVTAGGKHSAVLFEGVKDLLTAGVSQTTIQAGGTVTFFGSVAPDHTGHVIYLERQNASGTGFHVVQIATIGAGSSYSITHTVYDAGTKVFRVEIPGGPENEGAASPPFTIAVTPAPPGAFAPEPAGNTSGPSEGQS